MRIFPEPRAGLRSVGARLGLLSAFHEGCGAKGSSGCLEPWGCVGVESAASLAVHQHNCTIHLFLAVVVPEISPVDLEVATVKVRSCLPVSVSLWSTVLLSPPWAGRGHSHLCSCHVLSRQATDADSGPGGTLNFSIISVVFVEDSGASRPFRNLFRVLTTPDKDAYIGSIR